MPILSIALLGFAAAALWGFNQALISNYIAHVDPYLNTVIQSVVALLISGTIVVSATMQEKHITPPQNGKEWALLVVVGVIYTGGIMLFFSGYSLCSALGETGTGAISSVDGAVVIALAIVTQPLWYSVGQKILGEANLRPAHWIAGALVVSAVLIVVYDNYRQSAPSP